MGKFNLGKNMAAKLQFALNQTDYLIFDCLAVNILFFKKFCWTNIQGTGNLKNCCDCRNFLVRFNHGKISLRNSCFQGQIQLT